MSWFDTRPTEKDSSGRYKSNSTHKTPDDPKKNGQSNTGGKKR